MRRIKKARITHISLVPRGANKFPVLYKADTGLEFQALTKGLDERGLITAVVYAPEIVDAQGDVASAAVVEGMAHSFMKEMGQIDIRHSLQALSRDKVHVVESFVIQKGDSRFSDWKDYEGKPADVTGGWAVVLKVDDPELRALYKAGTWQGVSLYSPVAEFEAVAKTDLQKAIDDLAKRLGEKGESTMTPEEIKKMLAEHSAGIMSKMEDMMKTHAAAHSKAAEAPAPAAAPIFKGDATSADSVRKHLAQIKRSALAKDVDWSDPVAVEAHLGALEKAAEDAKLSETADEKIARLQKEVAERDSKIIKLSKASLQGTTDAPAPPPGSGMLSKDEQAGVAAGKRMAALAAARRGYKAGTGT